MEFSCPTIHSAIDKPSLPPYTSCITEHSNENKFGYYSNSNCDLKLCSVNCPERCFLFNSVWPAGWNLLVIYSKQKFYIDTCLPFGLRTQPNLFNHFSSALHWILEYNYGVEYLLHYLDDFFTAGPADSDKCEQNLNAMLKLCRTLNVPIKPSKVEGSTTSIMFLGIHLNTISMKANITSERKQSCYKIYVLLMNENYNLQLANFHLHVKSHQLAAAGQIFLIRLIDLNTTVKQLHHHIRVTVDARLDIYWWFNFLPYWSGKSLILENHRTPSTRMQPFTDASGTIGWGCLLV